MNELISINSSTIDGQTVNTVNARDLHAFLEVGKDFSNWIKAQIERARLVENRDYIIVAQKGENSGRGRSTIDYFLTIDAAKHVAMMSGTDKGFEVRDYFLECERRAQAATPAFQLPDFTNPIIAARAWADEVEKKAELEKQLQLQAPKVDALKRITMTEGEFNITTTAKILNLRPCVLFSYLEQEKYIFRRLGGKEWVAYQSKVQQGLFLHRTLTVLTPDGREKVIERCLVTPKGLAHLAEVFADKPQQHISGSRNVSKRQASIQ